MSNDKAITHSQVYFNVMELLVTEEVDEQLQALPERVLKYVRRSEVETFALNRLPALYACSEKGLHHQYERAHRELKPQVVSAVRQGFAAVQIDPIRLSKPLHTEADCHEADAVLQALKEWLRSPNLTWKTALSKIQRLERRGRATVPSHHTASETSRPPQGAAIPPSLPSTEPRTAWQPGTRHNHPLWKPRHVQLDSQGDDSGANA